MFKISKLGTVSLDALKGISYKLGILKNRTKEVRELQTVESIKPIEGYEFPHQHEELEEKRREIHRKIEDARARYKPPI